MTSTIAETLERALGNTLEVVRAFPEDKLDFWLAPNMMTITEQIEHLAHNLEYVVEPIATLYDHAPVAPPLNEPVPRLERAAALVNRVMAVVPASDWLRDVKYPDGYSMNVLQAALQMLEHDAHHRGQLIVALRILEIDPPKRWQSS
jgi:hypothetical protein